MGKRITDIMLPETVVTPNGGYTRYTGNETFLPAYEDFKQAEIERDRVGALNKMLSINAPVDPNTPNRNLASIALGYLGVSDNDRRFIFGKDDERRSCLYTVSSQYNDTPVAGNIAFSEKPEQYGFKEINQKEAVPGDLVQFWKHGKTPSHATMFTGYSPEGTPLISYSNGNIEPYREWHGPDNQYSIKDNIIINRDITDKDVQDLGTEHYYRYIGSPKKQEQIGRRYDMLKSGERIYKEGGSLKNKSWESLSAAEKAGIMRLAIQNNVYNLNDIRQVYNEFAEGGNIHIKPENRGKFTALKERTGHSASWFKEHGTPAQKKMATFALNARKWKH